MHSQAFTCIHFSGSYNLKINAFNSSHMKPSNAKLKRPSCGLRAINDFYYNNTDSLCGRETELKVNSTVEYGLYFDFNIFTQYRFALISINHSLSQTCDAKRA